MAVTQLDIARRVGLDVSSVNKILNRRPGPVFRKDTIKQVFKIARELGYDFGRLKYHHKRGSARRPMAVPLELSIYNADGTLFDKGAAIVKDVSLSGALLTAVVLPQQSIPLRPHTIGIRMLDGAPATMRTCCPASSATVPGQGCSARTQRSTSTALSAAQSRCPSARVRRGA